MGVRQFTDHLRGCRHLTVRGAEELFSRCTGHSRRTEMCRTPRDDVSTWITPTSVSRESQAEIIVTGYKRIGDYDARSGKKSGDWKEVVTSPC